MNTSYEQLIAPRLLDSRLKLHLLLQFLIHSQLATTASTLSERLRENPWAVAEALAELAEQNMLTSVTIQGLLMYRLGSDIMHLAGFKRLAEDFNDPLKRDLIHKLVQMAHCEREYCTWLTADELAVGQ